MKIAVRQGTSLNGIEFLLHKPFTGLKLDIGYKKVTQAFISALFTD
jgi:hypothetical protein